MQPCNRIYYSKIDWRLNMFRAACRSSSGAPKCICSFWFIYTCGDRPLSRLGESSHPPWATAGHHMCIETRGCKYSLELLMMSGMPLETCWAFNQFWNNKFCYNVTSCWLFLLIHTTMHASINIKFIKITIFRKVRTKTILKIYNTLVLPTFLYGSENWTLDSLTETKNWSGRNEVIETSGRLHPLWPQNKRLRTPGTTDWMHTRQDRWIQTELAFTLAKNAT